MNNLLTECLPLISDSDNLLDGCHEYEDGTCCWYLRGYKHREGAPAVLYPNGDEEWYLHGRLSRPDGPAMIRKGQGRYWMKNGIFHRLGNKPALITRNEKEWYVEGELHRSDGPAVVRKNGTIEWYINGTFLGSSVEEWRLQNGIPPWNTWTNTEKTLFRLCFSGC